MTKSQILAALAAIVLATGVAVSSASAQQPRYSGEARPAAGVRSQIGLIDVDHIFRNHQRYKNMVKAVQESQQAVRARFLEDKKGIQKQMKKLGTLRVGSVDYKQLDEQITRAKHELQTQAELKEKEFELYKVRMLHTIHSEIRQEVASIASARGFTMVLKFGNSEPIDPGKPQQLVRDIGSMVMYSAPGVDITNEVLARLDRRYPNNNNATGNSYNRTGGIPPRHR